MKLTLDDIITNAVIAVIKEEPTEENLNYALRAGHITQETYNILRRNLK